MEDNLQNVFFQLLRLGLWGTGKLVVSRALSHEEWATIYQYARNHSVEGVLYDSFSLLTEDELPPRMLRMKWTVRVDEIERHNNEMRRVVAAQFANFVHRDIKPVLLKGLGVANYYPIPSHRISGDIDWYFEKDGYDKALIFLRNNGITVNSPMKFCLDYQWQGIQIEHHRRLFDVRSLFKTSYLKVLEQAYHDKQQSILIGNESVTILAPELQILQVNVHILKHLLGFGIGMRQISDAAVLYRAYRDIIDADQLRDIYKKAGILKWIHVLHGILVKYLGLPKEDLPFPYPDKLEVDWMMKEIWYSGNFGYYDHRYADEKTSFISAYPGGAKRLLRNTYLYFKYAPQEVIFFPLRRATARFTSFFSSRG